MVSIYISYKKRSRQIKLINETLTHEKRNPGTAISIISNDTGETISKRGLFYEKEKEYHCTIKSNQANQTRLVRKKQTSVWIPRCYMQREKKRGTGRYGIFLMHQLVNTTYLKCFC